MVTPIFYGDPCCGLEVEHLQHILFVCPCWSSQRTFFLASLRKLINLTTSRSQMAIIDAHDFEDQNLLNLILILGGSHKSLSLGKFWYSAPTPPRSWDLESPDGYRPMFLLISHFFSSIIPLRLVLLRACCATTTTTTSSTTPFIYLYFLLYGCATCSLHRVFIFIFYC
jgi:hypothetical protein